ncbi:MAG: RHS repeat-associated core domain-containing protein, partial [Lachnospiraceae bacterium]
NETQYSVDLNDNVTKMTQANGGEYTYSYDKAGRLKSMTSPLGYTKNFSYDKVDNVVKESDSLKSTTTYTYDKLHNMKSSTNALDGTTSFSYDKYGNLVKETDPLGRSNTYSYDLAGQMTSAADPLGKITAYTYDPAGNITEITKPGGRKTSYGYDKNYNVTSVTDPMGYVAKTVYDKDNRVTEETDALGQKESYTYDKDSRVTSITDKRGFTTGFDYDAHGNIQVVTDKTGLKSHLEYDKNDNLTKVTDALGGVTTYGYDNMDNLVTFTNAANKTTNYTYDLEGNLTSIKDPAGRTEKFDYDEKGRLTGHTQASGKKTTYDYDKLNDLLEKSYQDAKGETSEKDVTYAYNSAGERVSMKDQTGKSSYEYDALGRITKVTSGSKKDVSYVYDDADNLQAIVYPDGTKISYEYDLNDNLVKLTDRNRKVTTYKHDALNRVTEVTRSNGTKTEVSYDAEDHITKIVNTCGSCGKVISTYEYKYNDQGYVVGETATELEAGTRKTPSWEDWYNWGDTQKETDKADCEHQEKEIQTTRTYEYDDNWELTRCTEKAEGGKKTVHNYTYDKIGNRTSYEKIEDGVSKAKYNYKYNDSNQLIKRTNAKIWGDPGTTYSYDKDGNLIQECDKTNSADPVTYEYTAENRLAVVKQGGTVLMAAMYDGDNNRVFELDNTYKWEDCYGDEVLIPANQRTEDGNSPKEQLASLVKGGSNAKGYTLTEYINDINRENTEVLAEYGADEKVRQAYTYGESGIGERVSVDKSEESSYYLYDGRNSVTGILTETANLTNSYQYDSYGNLTSGTADGVNYYGYNGESTNVKTGLQYLRARYYNAENGTFTTEDSDLGTTENPLTRNRYDYTTNNPLNYSDPTGHSLWSRIKSTAKKAAKAVKSVGKKIVNTAKKVVKTVVNTAKKAAKTIVNTVKGVAKTAKNAAKHAKQTYQSVKNRVTSSSTYQKITSRGSQFIRSVSNGVQKIGKTYTSFKSYVSERTAEIRSEVVRHMCTTTNRITDKLGKVDWNAVKKVAIGITAVTVSGLVVAATGGLAAGAVLAALPAMGGLGTAMVSGAVIGAIGGASYSAVNSGLSGNSLKQVAKDTLVGGIAGAVTGGVMGGLSYGAGKLLNVVRSAGSTHNDGIDKSFKKLVAEVTETKLPEGTWEKPPLERGDIIDKAMGNNLGHNFPTIDKVENGVVTSVKSRDLGAKTYQNGNKLEKVIVKDINKVSGFIGETFNGKFVNAEEIVGRQLQVVVPNVTLSEAQINAVNNATKHGIDKGVKLIITVGK